MGITALIDSNNVFVGTPTNPLYVDVGSQIVLSGSVSSAPVLATALITNADVVVTGSSNAALPSIVAGPNGIDVDADLGNTVIVRVAATNAVSATLGRRLQAGDTIRFQVQNANEIYAQTEDGSSQKLQVSQS